MFQLLEMSRTDIRKLQDNLLLKYSAGHPQNIELYHQAIVNTKGFIYMFLLKIILCVIKSVMIIVI